MGLSARISARHRRCARRRSIEMAAGRPAAGAQGIASSPAIHAPCSHLLALRRSFWLHKQAAVCSRPALLLVRALASPQLPRPNSCPSWNSLDHSTIITIMVGMTTTPRLYGRLLEEHFLGNRQMAFVSGPGARALPSATRHPVRVPSHGSGGLCGRRLLRFAGAAAGGAGPHAALAVALSAPLL